MTSLDQIINGCKRHDLKYQKLLFEGYARKMKYVCMRYLQQDLDAEDALQEGFIKLFSCIHQFNGEGAFEGWMRKIFVNTALIAIRKRKVKKEDLMNEAMDENVHTIEASDMEEGIEARDINHDRIDFSIIQKAEFSKEELLSCINELKDDYKIVFNLFFLDNFKHAEIAALLNIEENTSRTRLARARKKIQEELYKRSIKKVSV